MDDDRYTRITLRIPKDLHSRLAGEADDSSKSMNAEIVARLQQSFDASPGDATLKAKLEAAEKTIESHESHEFAIRWVSTIKDSLLGALLKAAEDAGVQGAPVDLARQFLNSQESKDIAGLGKTMDRILGVSASEKQPSEGAPNSAAGEGLGKRDLEKIILARTQEIARMLRVTTKPLDEQ